MEFLKEILGEDLYKQLEEKINAYNANEANKDKQIKIANLGTGEYVSKLKFEDLNSQMTSKSEEIKKANELIEELKKGTKGNEELQSKITAYDSQIAELQEELKTIKLNSAIKVALMSEKAVDVDYLTYKLNAKLKEEGKTLELDNEDNIKDWKNISTDLHTAYPKYFENSNEDGTGGSGGYQVIDNNRLNRGNGNNDTSEPKTLAEALEQQFRQNNNNT